MGLDSYIEYHDKDEPEKTTEVIYYRKFNNLHGWMANLYASKGNTEEFNCERLYLDREDLHKLSEDACTLEPTKGFFFGSQEPMTEEKVQGLKKVIKECIALIEQGKEVFYYAWY